MRKTDISKYNTTTTEFKTSGENQRVANFMVRSVLTMLLQILKTSLFIVAIAGIITFATVLAYILSMRNQAALELQKTTIDLKYTTFVYAENEEGIEEEYMAFYNIENRVWVDYADIPKAMKDAQVAIEDKRFFEHKGVDIKGTGAAIFGLVTGDNRGGSTITQQLIKNITGENQVSLNRKIKEIFSALALEKKYTKPQILESYLNVVNYGNGCNGVQAAAKSYFGKDIKDCSIAECAAIAGITQNPYGYNPYFFPEENKEKREIVIQYMLEQEMISQDEYEKAMRESANMKFGSDDDEEENENAGIWDWYTDAMFDKLVIDLKETLGCSTEMAEMMIYQGGLTIHSAMDMRAQNIAEEVYSNPEYRPSDKNILSGFHMMDFDGRVLATVGSFEEKEGNRVFSNAVDASRQSGSTIKPISVYSLAIDKGLVNYSSLVSNEPIPHYFPDGSPGPYNWNGEFSEGETVQYALEISLNVPAAQLCNKLSTFVCYQHLTENLGFKHLDPEQDSNLLGSMSIGGHYGGATVEEVTAAFQIFGNGGVYNEPYYYYYVEDHDGKVIIDNRDKIGQQVISSETATITNKLLRQVMYGYEGTAYGTGVYGWDCYGKTGTTDANKDAWFVGATEACVAGVWTGYDIPEELSTTTYAKRLWNTIMTKYLEPLDPSDYSYELDYDVISATFCKETGNLATSSCEKTATGWYTKGRLPSACKDDHVSSSSALSSNVSSNVSSQVSSAVSSAVSSKPESSKPVSSKPESSKPESSKPESSKPESSAPVSSAPESQVSSTTSSVPESSSEPPVSSEAPASSEVETPSTSTEEPVSTAEPEQDGGATVNDDESHAAPTE